MAEYDKSFPFDLEIVCKTSSMKSVVNLGQERNKQIVLHFDWIVINRLLSKPDSELCVRIQVFPIEKHRCEIRRSHINSVDILIIRL